MENNDRSMVDHSVDSMGRVATADRAHDRTIHVLVEAKLHEPPLQLDFDTDQVIGRTIKERAGIPLDNDLARRRGQKLELVTNDESIMIANGDHFVSLPPGTIS